LGLLGLFDLFALIGLVLPAQKAQLRVKKGYIRSASSTRLYRGKQEKAEESRRKRSKETQIERTKKTDDEMRIVV
jgi:hypothetical protein